MWMLPITTTSQPVRPHPAACAVCLPREIVKRLDMWGVDMLFVVGGNGGNAGANAIQQKCEESDVLCNVIGVPKSIDNDILLIDKCFGFDTAVEEAQRALLAAKVGPLLLHLQVQVQVSCLHFSQ